MDADEGRLGRARATFVRDCERASDPSRESNKVPAFAVTLTGGLRHASDTIVVDPGNCFALLLLSGIPDVGLLTVALGIGDVLGGHFEAIRASDATASPRNASVPRLPWLGGHAMVSIYALVPPWSASLSPVGAFVFLGPMGWR